MSTSGGQAPALIASGDSLTAPTALPVDAFTYILDDTSSTWRRFLSARSLADGDAGAYYPAVASRLKAGGNFDVARTPNTFKRVATAASGDTALWTPAAGKKFRLMRFRIEITGNATIGGGAVLTTLLRDAATSLEVGGAWFVPAAAGTTLIQVSTPWIDLGNGALSSAANNVLNVNLSLALATGSLVTWVAGTEE